MKEDEMVEWHHQHDGHEFEQSSGDSEGQGILACYSPRDCKEKLNNSKWPFTIGNFLNHSCIVARGLQSNLTYVEILRGKIITPVQ